MSDSYGEPQQQGGQGEGSREGFRGRGGRGGSREGGGFRIRLSDNEMRSARALQEAFNLRSTVAVLGFAVRSLGQMLEDGQLEALIEQQRNQPARTGRRSDGEGRDGGGRDGGGRDGGGRDGGGRGRRSHDERGGRGSRPDPFARPSKPQQEAEPVSEAVSEPAETVADDPLQDPAQTTETAPSVDSETANEA